MTSLTKITNGRLSNDGLANAAMNVYGMVATGLALFTVINLMSPTPSVFAGGLYTEAPVAQTR